LLQIQKYSGLCVSLALYIDSLNSVLLPVVTWIKVVGTFMAAYVEVCPVPHGGPPVGDASGYPKVFNSDQEAL
jgi:hypothetical protein